MRHALGQRKDKNHGGERGEIAQVVGQPVLAQHDAECMAGDDAETHATRHDQPEGRQQLARRRRRLSDHDEVEHEYRQDGAQRVDQDAFPAHNGGHGLGGANAADQGYDHRRSADRDNGAEQGRQQDIPTQQPGSGSSCHEPGNQDAEADQVPNDLAVASYVADFERQASFVKDDGNGHRDDGCEQVAEQNIGVEPVEPGAQHDSNNQ